MEDFTGGVRRRAREAVRAARDSGDSYAAQVHAADLEEMLRLADEHGIAVDPEGED
ncbi:hypothetical protein [Streptosporangium sp. NPDC000396]|uniref:hypothetical protein n=1 Tax=Streptosporangium sp. NPDC000396 TaxID=3366185 RepID=UPI00367CD8EB